MDLLKQVTSVETSKQLQELAVKNDAGLFWVYTANGKYDTVLTSDDLSGSSYHWIYNTYKPLAAYTVAELGELLPVHIALPYKDVSGGWFDPNTNSTPHRGWYETEVEARAAALIKLLSDGKI